LEINQGYKILVTKLYSSDKCVECGEQATVLRVNLAVTHNDQYIST